MSVRSQTSKNPTAYLNVIAFSKGRKIGSCRVRYYVVSHGGTGACHSLVLHQLYSVFVKS
jgi:hypothetical protein